VVCWWLERQSAATWKGRDDQPKEEWPKDCDIIGLSTDAATIQPSAWSPELISIIQAAGWPIWPLILCSVIGLALVIERFISLKAGKIFPPKLLEEAIMVSRDSVPGPEVVAHLEQNSAFGAVLASGFQALMRNPRASEDDIRSSLEGAGRMAAAGLQRYLGALATIASAAPLLGLLGTVIGMIEIFGSQGADGGMGTIPGAGNPAQLASGISIALYNTAFGLMVAIPALIFWRYFRGRIDDYLLNMELASERFARHLVTLRR
jgi:biopolymer transport protein ExbB